MEYKHRKRRPDAVRIPNSEPAAAAGGGYGALRTPASAAATPPGSNSNSGARGGRPKSALKGRRRRDDDRPKSALKGRRRRDDDRDEVENDNAAAGVEFYGALHSPNSPGPQGPPQPHGRGQPKHNLMGLASRPTSAGRRKSAGRQGTATTPSKMPTGGRKGWGGFLRRRKNSKQATEDNNVCDYCHREVEGKRRSEMYQREEYAYCSTNCTKLHQRVLEEDAEELVAMPPNNLSFVEGNFTSPPVTPSAALIQQRTQAQGVGDVNVSNRDDYLGRNDSNAFTVDWFAEENDLSRSFSKSLSMNGSSSRLSTNGSGLESFRPSESWSHSPVGTNGTPTSIRVDYGADEGVRPGSFGRGVSDEYREYDDELSRQLKLAARQDELECEEKVYQRQQFVKAHVANPATTGFKDMSPNRFNHIKDVSPGRLGHINVDSNYSPSRLSQFSHASGNANSNINVGESTPMRYNSNLKGMGINGMAPTPENDRKSRNIHDRSNNSNGDNKSSRNSGISSNSSSSNNNSSDIHTNNKVSGGGKNRKKHPSTRNENSTQSKESVYNNSNNIHTNNKVSGGGKNRKKQPATRNESSTQSTESLSSSSQGFDICHSQGFDVSPASARGVTSPLETTATRSARSSASSKTSWGYLDVSNSNDDDSNSWKAKRSNSSVRKAFEQLGEWPEIGQSLEWELGDSEGLDADGADATGAYQSKTPRIRNSSKLHASKSLRKSDGDAQNSPDPDGSKTDQNVGPDYKSYNRQVSSLSTASQPKLHRISEERTPNDGDGSRDNSEEDPAFYLFAQRKGLRPVGSVGGAVRRAKLDNSIVSEDMTSDVYDDPSVGVLSSLATNDTLTTNGRGSLNSSPRGSPRGSPAVTSGDTTMTGGTLTFRDRSQKGESASTQSSKQGGGDVDVEQFRLAKSVFSKGTPPRGSTTKQPTKDGRNDRRKPATSSAMKMTSRSTSMTGFPQQQQGKSCDPPGNSIDEILKRGIRGGKKPGTSFDPHDGSSIATSQHDSAVSFHGLDPSVHSGTSWQRNVAPRHGLEPSIHSGSSQQRNDGSHHGLEPSIQSGTPGNDASHHGLDPSIQGEDPSMITPQQPWEGDSQSPFQSPQRQQKSPGVRGAVVRFPHRQRKQQEPPQIQHFMSPPKQQHQQHNLHSNSKSSRHEVSSRVTSDGGHSQQHQSPNDMRSPPHLHRTMSRPRGEQLAVQEEYPNLDDIEEEHKFDEEFDDQEDDGDEPEEDGFDLSNIEFPVPENLEEPSLGQLTGSKGDDDTATNTLDTIDLVAEVKRVWRHVQRYEKKKQKRRQARRRYTENQHMSDITGDDTGDFGNSPADVEEDEDVDDDGPMEEQGEGSQEMMMGLMQQFNQLQMQHQELQHQELQQQEQNMLETMQHQQVQHHHRHHLDHRDGDGGDSKFSDITPSSSYHVLKTTINSNARGRSTEPGPDNGRLGTHIRSTSANSRTHTPVPASPGLDSNFAIESHTTGTEKDVEFLNEGVDAFYEEQAATSESFESANNSKGAGVAPKWPRVARPKASRHHSQHALQQHSTSRSKSRSTEEGEAQQTPHQSILQQKYSQSHSRSRSQEDEDPGNLPSSNRGRQQQQLATPYDMTKTKSTGTSFTQKTEKASNTTPLGNEPPAARLRSEKAWKYKMQKKEGGGGPGTTLWQVAAASRVHVVEEEDHNLSEDRRHQQSQQQQQREEYRQATQRQHGEQPWQQRREQPSASVLYTKAIQNARERRAHNGHRLS